MLKFTLLLLFISIATSTTFLALAVKANTQNFVHSPEVKNGMRRALKEGLARFGGDVNNRSAARASPIAAYRGLPVSSHSPVANNRFLDQRGKYGRSSSMGRSGSKSPFLYRSATTLTRGSPAPDKLAAPVTALRTKSFPEAKTTAPTAATPVASTTSDRYVSKAQESLLEAENQIANLQGVLMGEKKSRAELGSNSEVGALRKALEEQMKLHENLTAEHAKLKGDLEAEKQSHQKVDEEKRKLLEDHSALKAKLAEFDKIKTQGEQIEQLKKNLEEEIQKHTAKIGQLESSQGKLQEELNKEMKLRTTAEEKRRKLKEDLESQQKELGKEAKLRTSAEEEHRKLKEDLEGQLKELGKEVKLRTSAEEEHRKLKENLEGQLKELRATTTKQKQSSLKKEQDFGVQLKKELGEQQRKCKAQLADLKTLNAKQVAQLQQQLVEARQAKASLEEVSTSLRADTTRLASRVKTLESAIERWGLPVPPAEVGQPGEDRHSDEAMSGVCVKRGFVPARQAELSCQCDMGSAVRAMQHESVTVGDKTDMAKAMQDDAIRIARRASKKSDKLSNIVTYVKSEFEKRYGLYWQCVAGTNLDFFIVWNYSNLIDFRLGQVRVLLFKTVMY